MLNLLFPSYFSHDSIVPEYVIPAFASDAPSTPDIVKKLALERSIPTFDSDFVRISNIPSLLILLLKTIMPSEVPKLRLNSQVLYVYGVPLRSILIVMSKLRFFISGELFSSTVKTGSL